MAHVVYHKESTLYLCRCTRKERKESFATVAAAKAALTRAARKDPAINASDFDVAESNHFHSSIEKTRMTRNMLNPNAGEFPIPVNTPSYCDPGCESYHSM